MTYPPVPRYEYTRDAQNPFYWILATTQKTREEREAMGSRRHELSFTAWRKEMRDWSTE